MGKNWTRRTVVPLLVAAATVTVNVGDDAQARDRLRGMLTAPIATSGAEFGHSVALDGDTMVVGARSGGAVYVYVRAAGAWALQAELTSVDAQLFGTSLALDGDTLVVGALDSAYVFTRSDGVWSSGSQLTGSRATAGDDFGESVAVDGDTIVVGAPYDEVDGESLAGSAYVFQRSAQTWDERYRIEASDASSVAYFGWSVALHGDDVLVGAWGEGAAYAFLLTETSWSQQARLTSGSDFDAFGSSVSLVGDTAVVGAMYADVGANSNQGAVYVFTRSEEVWSEQAFLAARGGESEEILGHAVAFDGHTLVAGAYNGEVDGVIRGRASVFVENGGAWTERGQLTAPDGASGDLFGYSVAVDGNDALVGAPGYSRPEAAQGAAYLFNVRT
jgi:hypothetical protein